ncbi:MAG TPA: hypothetical protein VIY27_07855 [Myxococcota bacterium]
MTERRQYPVCVTRADDNAMKFWTGHEPIPATVGGHFTVNMTLGTQKVALLLCRRCGVAYVAREEITFAEPSPDATRGQGGSA